MKAAIYDPYLDTLGGGERYCLTLAEILLKNGYSVDLFWSGDISLVKAAENRFSLDLSNINLKHDIFDLSTPKSRYSFSKISNIIKKYKITRNYDIFFYLSDGSIPLIFSKNNLLHCQVPLILKKSLLNAVKVNFFNHIICNSKFTANVIESVYGKKTDILYPPVDVEKFYLSPKKENIILSVGRFDNILNAKKQDILIEAFKTISKHNKNWKLVLAGGSLQESTQNTYLAHLKFLAKNLPVTFIVNPKFSDLRDIYAKSKIYWHAAGFGVDEKLMPQNTEHFGMAVVEAMASGSVPVVVAKGGLTEIVSDGNNGYLWKSVEELISKTQLLISSKSTINSISFNASASSKTFSKSNFEKQFFYLLNQK